MSDSLWFIVYVEQNRPHDYPKLFGHEIVKESPFKWLNRVRGENKNLDYQIVWYHKIEEELIQGLAQLENLEYEAK
jgi:hypothetical protein